MPAAEREPGASEDQPDPSGAVSAEEEHPASARNVRHIAQLIEERRQTLTTSERVGRAINRVVGSLWFVGGHAVGFLAWAMWNVTAPASWRFDPYPFGLMTMIVSLEGVLVAAFIVVNQNRLSAEADRRDHLNLQIDLLNEQEVTQAIRILGAIAQRLDVPIGRDVEHLLRDTDVRRLLTEIDAKMPTD